MNEKNLQTLNPNQILIRVSAAMAIGLVTIIALLFLAGDPSSSSAAETDIFLSDS